MTRRPDVSVVMVSYNSADWLRRSLGSLPAGCRDTTYEVVVVDNASADDSVAVLRRDHPHVRVLANDRNEGFARAVNAGAAASSGTWVLLLNPDTEVLPGSIDRLVEFARRHPGHGLYGGRTLTPEGRLDPSSCWGMPTVWSTACFALGLSTAFRRSPLLDPESLGHWQRDTAREVGFVSGSLLLVPRAVWTRLGGLDERYFVYGEDADLGARARALGFRPVITPDAVIVHAVGASSSREDKLALLMAGKTTFIEDHFAGARRPAGLALLRSGVALRAALSRVSGRGHGWAGAWRRRREWWTGFPPRPS